MTITRLTTKARIINSSNVIAYYRLTPLFFGVGLYRIYIEDANE